MEEKNVIKSSMQGVVKGFIIMILIIVLSGIFFTFSLYKVYNADTTDSAFKDHEEEYKALKE